MQQAFVDRGLTDLLNITQRGFTGHKHVDHADVIHMNGRIYDPTLGRFMQADPIVQAPDNLQSLNRYSYVFNNPLSYTDPTGYSAEDNYVLDDYQCSACFSDSYSYFYPWYEALHGADGYIGVWNLIGHSDWAKAAYGNSAEIMDFNEFYISRDLVIQEVQNIRTGITECSLNESGSCTSGEQISSVADSVVVGTGLWRRYTDFFSGGKVDRAPGLVFWKRMLSLSAQKAQERCAAIRIESGSNTAIQTVLTTDQFFLQS